MTIYREPDWTAVHRKEDEAAFRRLVSLEVLVPVEEPVYRIYGGSISATEPSREVRDWINEWLVKIGGDEE